MTAIQRRDFTNARSNARRRGIIWDLTFEEWAEAWRRSGKYHLRGRQKGQYQMDRKDSTMGYVRGNVQIVTGYVNRTKDSPHGWRPKLTEGAVREIRRDFRPRRVGWARLASRYGVSIATIKAVLTGRNWASVPLHTLH